MGQRVLIVDDHAGFRASARRMLECEGYEVVGEAPDGASAIAAARELRPDLVLLDVQLPDRDGFAVARDLTANCVRPTVIMISSREAADYGPLAVQSGARGFITKAELSRATMEALIA